ncbi:MAG: hypothetical protein K0S23_1119 [Fluviicola sp.]|jgi:hypothetical protein|nr:hypothetical protein [Fluviicola sp.]
MSPVQSNVLENIPIYKVKNKLGRVWIEYG